MEWVALIVALVALVFSVYAIYMTGWRKSA